MVCTLHWLQGDLLVYLANIEDLVFIKISWAIVAIVAIVENHDVEMDSWSEWLIEMNGKELVATMYDDWTKGRVWTMMELNRFLSQIIIIHSRLKYEK